MFVGEFATTERIANVRQESLDNETTSPDGLSLHFGITWPPRPGFLPIYAPASSVAVDRRNRSIGEVLWNLGTDLLGVAVLDIMRGMNRRSLQARQLVPLCFVSRFGLRLLLVAAAALMVVPVGILLSADVPASSPATSTTVDFERQVAPILLRHCSGCHNPSERAGGLSLMAREAAFGAGKSGEPAIKAGDIDDSYIVTRVEAGEMPPKGKGKPLAAEEIATLKRWIDEGAAWPNARVLSQFELTTATRAGRDWWSLKPLQDAAPPRVKDTSWVLNPIDAFILARLEENKLAHAPPADKRTLLRRVTFDLIGLPPSPSEIADFLADDSPTAYERVVDRLLASPHYGERWARNWLDVARFGESQGFEYDRPRPNAWRYRDWVIAAFNQDLPYDEFIRLQIAGDVLRPNDPQAVIATGFLVAGPWDEAGQKQQSAAMRAVVRQDELEDLAGTTAQTFLGLTVNCARCHDHKFDPISQVDYYRFAAALGGVRHGERECLAAEGRGRADARRTALDAHTAELEKQIAAIEEPIRRQLNESSDRPTAAPAPPAVPLERVLMNLSSDQRRDRDALVTQLTWLRQQQGLLSAGPAYAVSPSQPEPTHVLRRGNPAQQGDVVSPGGIAAASQGTADLGLAADAPEAERRIKLADWITGPAAPLAARVMVNRLWHYHFGVGIVDTPNDFGFNGGRPSHLELLDWLARRLIEEGWQIKPLQRTIVLSAAYRQSGRSLQKAEKLDADNRLIWRKSPVRLEAEALRDAILVTAGQFNPTMGGPGYRDFTTREFTSTLYQPIDPVGYEFNRRTIYRSWIRSGTNRFLDVFDCPDPSTTTPKRLTTTTPLQALGLWNNSFVLRMSDRFAERLGREAGDDLRRQIELAYQLALARPPRADELNQAISFVREQGLSAFCRVVFNSNEFLYID
ncbi:MAG TPA: PSD1 and planctomycete cytochrome C domain-containing protein [Pirellulales bacterium]|nr:PSD1 and planctomycete cytochrome C domain-containing protein [Pirellulales bacterium]